jgi:tripartite-type tricarboxylate transporter receptor subunit TctC
MKMKHLVLATCVVVALAGVGHGAARAETFPDKFVRMIVPFSPGSGADLLARAIAPGMQDDLKVPIVIENREGAAGLIGLVEASRAPKDGYTIVMSAEPPFSLAPLFQSSSTYDPLKSFAPLARLGAIPMVIVASPQSGVKDVADLRNYAKARPNESFYASNGNASPAQVTMELFKVAAGITLPEVNYKSTGQMTTDVAAGHVLTSFLSISSSEALIQSGKLRPLAVGSKTRLDKLPDVPTLAEALGRPEYRAEVAYEFFAPAGTAPERIQRLFDAIRSSMAQPKTQASLEQLSVVSELRAPADFTKIVQQDVANAQQVFEGLQKK